VAVDDDVAAAIHAAKEGIVGGFNAGAADDVAGRVESVAVVIGEHLLGDFADVADEVSGEAVAGVEATLIVKGFEFGELVSVGGDESLLIGGDVLLERNGLVLGGYFVVAEDGVDLIHRNMEALGDEGQIGIEIFDLFAKQEAGDGGIVVDEEAAFAVEELSAGSEDGNLADTVGFGERTEAFGVENLEAPESGEEDDENQRDEILGGMELADGQLFGLADGAGGVGFGMWMVNWFHCSISVYDWVAELALPLLCSEDVG
jgi:hypothetical protein